MQAHQDYSEESAEVELSEGTWNSSNGNEVLSSWQTDESKAAEQQTSSCRLQQPKTNKSSRPCFADTGNLY